MSKEPITKTFTIWMHVAQFVGLVLAIASVFFALKTEFYEFRIETRKDIATVNQDVTRIIDYLGVWRPREGRGR